MHCGFCTAVCPTYLILGDERDSPRGRIALIQNMLESDAPPTPETVEHLDRCLSCLGCRTACPSTVDYATLIDTARAHIEERFERPSARAHVPFGACVRACPPARVRVGLDARAHGAAVRGICCLHACARSRPRCRGASASPAPIASLRRPAVAGSRVALLPGCVQRALAPEIDFAARRVLARQGIEAAPLTHSGCCGALACHMGKTAIAKRQARALMDSCERAGAETVLITATGCAAFLKDYPRVFADERDMLARAHTFAARVRDFSELAEPRALAAPECRVAYHPPCSLQFGQRIAGKGEALLDAAGFARVGFADSHLCCGSAGSYSLLQPELSAELAARKTAAIAAAAPDVIATGNIGCLNQLNGNLSGGTLPAVHLAELLDWAAGGPKPVATTDGERQAQA